MLSRMPARFWERKGQAKAHALFRAASAGVPAYRAFLAEIGSSAIGSKGGVTQWKDIPLLSKSVYFDGRRGHLREYCSDGTFEASHAIARSSGHSGGPLFWPRMAAQEEKAQGSAESMYVNFWNVDRRKTLCVVTFDLGMWIAGEMCADCSREIAKKYPMTVVTPGSRLDEALATITELSPLFEQTIIYGYPPFLGRLLEKGREAGLDWTEMNAVLIPAGEGYSERWRDYVLGLLGREDSLVAVLGLFGASEGAIIGHETPLSILVKRLAEQDGALRQTLFGSQRSPYCLVQYHPLGAFIEQVDGEVVITVGGALPLVRYNTHDKGGVIRFQELADTLESHGYRIRDMLLDRGISDWLVWQLPFFYTFGRSDSVIIDGANIYVDNVQPAFARSDLAAIRGWKLAVQEDASNGMRLTVFVEAEGHTGVDDTGAAALAALCHDSVVEQLVSCNADFASALANNPDSCDPEIVICAEGQPPFDQDRSRLKPSHLL